MRFLARFEVVVLNSRALLVLGIWGLDVKYLLARLRYVEDSAFILSGRWVCGMNRLRVGRSRHSALFAKCDTLKSG